MYKSTVPALLFLSLFCAVQTAGQPLVVYPSAGVLPMSPDFIVRVRVPGKSWNTVPVYQVKVADGGGGISTVRESSMAYFDFSGTVEVAVSPVKRRFDSVRVRPLSYGIGSRVVAGTVFFSLDRPRNLSVEPDGDIFGNLQIFAGAPETAVPDRADTNTIYYGPGVHHIGRVYLASGKRVYLAGGAVVEGQFLIDHQQDVRISGRGIFCQPAGSEVKYGSGRRDAIKIDYSGNVSVEGIIILPNSYTVLVGQSRSVQLRNIKSFSSGGNHDGIDVFCSRDILMEGLFMRNSDDCIAIYGHRWNYYGNVAGVTVRNSTLWADVAHPILVGTHGDPIHPDTLGELRFSNIDILDQHENQIDYQGCMSLNAGDSNLIRDVRFEDIRVEDIRKGQLVNLRVMYNKKYNTAPGKGIENVLFKNISYTGSRAGLSVIAGYDDAHPIKNITFENLRINGRVVADKMPGKPGWYKTADMADFFVGEHVEQLRFE